MNSDILVIDDEEDIRELVAGLLEDEGHDTRMAHDSTSALEAIDARAPQLVFLDIWLQGSKLDGLEVLDEIKKRYPELPVVMISGHGTVETAVSAIQRGAYDFIEKPFKAERLLQIADRALEAMSLKREVQDLRKKSGGNIEFIGRSAAVIQLKQILEKVGPTNSRVLISGPAGAGKEIVARTIHEASSRSARPFVTVNAASMTPEHFEVELFGTEGDDGPRKIGALEEAHRGTLYIDEIADMPRETQGKILRVLTDQQFFRVGGSTKVKVDVRIISSTSQNMPDLIEKGRFRSDLYHRLAVVPVLVPALAQRREDVPLLIDAFMKQIANQTGIRPMPIGNDAMAVLQTHEWPGNVRQLRNTIERLMILCRDEGNVSIITSDMLPPEIGESLPSAMGEGDAHIMSLPLREARERFEKDYLIAQIGRFGGNISRTAEFIGMERSALHRKLKSLGV